MSAVKYEWQCLACGTQNPPGASHCSLCACPAHARHEQIQSHRPQHIQQAEAAQLAAAAQEKADWEQAKQAMNFRRYYWLSLIFFLLSLTHPKLYMPLMILLSITPYALMIPPALAYPLLIFCYVLLPRANNPGKLRWMPLAAAILILSGVLLERAWEDYLAPFFFILLCAALVLLAGLQRLRQTHARLLTGSAKDGPA